MCSYNAPSDLTFLIIFIFTTAILCIWKADSHPSRILLLGKASDYKTPRGIKQKNNKEKKKKTIFKGQWGQSKAKRA